MRDGPRLERQDSRGSHQQWVVLFALWLAFLLLGVVRWGRGRPETYVGEHAAGVLLPLCGLSLAAAALGRQAARGGNLLRAVAWGAILAAVLLRIYSR